MVSKNCPGYITGYIKKKELFIPMLSNENKYALLSEAEIVTLNGEIITVDEEVPQKCLADATTCN